MKNTPTGVFNRRTFFKSIASAGFAFYAPKAWSAGRFSHGFLDETPCGVASGEPQAHSIVLWTRVPPEGRDRFANTTEVIWQLATDSEFSSDSMAAEGKAQTSAVRDWTVKVMAKDLEPKRTYWYRFMTDRGWKSDVGRTKTLPLAGAHVERFKFAFISCQDYSLGYYNVLEALQREDLDFVIHLGDAIYAEGRETYQQGAVREDKIGNGAATTLDEYRSKYLLYLSDPVLRELRRKYPIVYLSDDHELWNDFPHLAAGRSERRSHAMQAHCEYIPNHLNVMNESQFNSANLYRSFQFGDLATFIALDLRSYRSDIPCDRANASWGCSVIDDSSRTILGPYQKAWLKDELTNAESKWKFSLSSVMMMPLRISVASWLTRQLIAGILGGEPASYRDLLISADSWDGFPIERQELLEFIHREKVSGFVSLAGDIHNYSAGGLHVDPFDLNSPLVGHELVTASVTSNGLSELFGYISTQLLYPFLSEGNPHFSYLDSYYHGCIVMDVSHRQIVARRVAVDNIKSPNWQPVQLENTVVRGV